MLFGVYRAKQQIIMRRSKKMLGNPEASGRMKSKQSETLPKMQPLILPGTVHTQYIRCGRARCKCASGELHGPYYYRFFRAGGRLHKRYVRRVDVASVETHCKARQEQSAYVRRIVLESRQEWKRLMAAIRQMEQEGTWEK